ncbi:MAG TPA: DEAD/DEAH box helicase, partial [Planctomycetota bacterium]|nr:DEAD/DEAH box helicase [Planctomycetota bacterium]
MTPDARRSPTQSPLDLFSEPVRNWFLDRFDGPSPAQTRAWPLVSRGENVLVSAPTGSGKTLAAFLAAIDGLAREGSALPDEIRVVYVSPLRALSND